MRIANIIYKSDVNPSSVLALTFTDNAANNMRRRLVSLIGKDAYHVTIETFHGFCNNLIQSRPDIFTFKKNLVQVDDLTKIKIITEILESQSLEKLKNFSNPSLFIGAILRNISILKREGFNAESFQAKVKEHRDFFEANAEYSSADKLKGKWADYNKQILKNTELASVYIEYETQLLERSLYDYDDMILMVCKALETNADFIADVRERYLYTLVDEYQDTNGGQNKLLLLLNEYDEQPNLFVVGDEDQSIYSFQGANLRNILEFKERFPAAKLISTKYNYRSRQKVLDIAMGVISNNQERFNQYYPEIQKELIAGSKGKFTTPQEEAAAVVIENDNDLQELDYLLATINSLHDSGVAWERIALVYRNHADAKAIINRLVQEGIPYRSETTSNILGYKPIKKIISLFRFLQNPYANYELIQILHLNIWDVPALDIFKLLRYYRSLAKDLPLLEILKDAEHLRLIGLERPEKLQEAVSDLGKLYELAQDESIERLYLQVLQSTHLLSIASDSGNAMEVRAFYSFNNFIKHRLRLNPDYSLEALCADLDRISENGLEIKDTAVSSYSDGVNLLTAHAAKGLEFDYVFMFRVVNNSWGNKKDSDLLKLVNLYNLGLPEKVDRAERLEEERRLFYVSLTRAKEKIWLSFANNYFDHDSGKNRQTQPSMFIQELLPELVENVHNTDTAVDLAAQLKPVAEHDYFASATQNYLQQLVSEFTLSFTALVNYLECPTRFLYVNLLGLPTLRDKHRLIGSVVHHLIQQYNLVRLKGGTGKTLAELQESAEQYIAREPLSSREKEDVANEVIRIFADYYPELNRTVETILEVEYQPRKSVLIEGVPVTGKIDAIEAIEMKSENSGSAMLVRVVDYKTSKPLSQNALLGNTQSPDYVKNYYRQLLFYKLMLEADPRSNYLVGELVLDFTRANERGKFKRETFTGDFTAAALEIKQLIVDVNMKIHALDFGGKCEKPECPACALL
jgi:DNA helicase-2/ATP-dependent DNA helicase PcrA